MHHQSKVSGSDLFDFQFLVSNISDLKPMSSTRVLVSVECKELSLERCLGL